MNFEVSGVDILVERVVLVDLYTVYSVLYYTGALFKGLESL